MKYFLLITNSDGETRLVPISDVMEVSVAPGDDIVVMDESGNAVDVSLRPEEDDLIVEFKDNSKAVLKDFYNQEEDAEPVTISLNPVEPVADDYEFNSQTGNLPNAKSFTLMRFSNTEYVQFVEQLDELRGGVIEGALQDFNSGGNSGGDGGECCEKTDGPGASPDEASGTAGGPPITLNLITNDTDPLGGGLEIHSIAGIGVIPGESITLASGTVVNVNSDGEIEVEPGSSFDALGEGESGTETFTYSVIDADGNIATSQVTVTVTGVNDPPRAVEDEFRLEEGNPVTVDLLANDSDPDTNDTLTVTDISDPPFGTVSIDGGGTVTYDPQGGFENLAVGETATVTLTYEISDDHGSTATSTVTFVVEGANDAPDALNDVDSTDQGVPITIDVLGNDVDPDTNDQLIITGVTQPAKGLVLHNQGDITFDPGDEFDALGAGESETVTFEYSISDGNGGTDTASVTITVHGTDDATVTAPDHDITDENTPVVVDVLANDTDPDTSDIPLTVTGVTQPPAGQGSVTISNGGEDVTFDPGTDFDDLAVGESETVTFTYTTDTGATENVTITVNGKNDAPDAIDDLAATDQDTPIVIDVVSNDIDPDTSDELLIIGFDQPSKGTVTLNSQNQLIFDPGDDFDFLDASEDETVTFNYTISDGNGGTATATVAVFVEGREDPTVTAPDADETDENTPVTVDVLANDTDPDTNDNPLTVTGVTQPGPNQGSVAISNGGANLTFSPESDFDYLAVGESATVNFTYTTDTGVTEDVTITVNGTNDGPTAVNDISITDEDSPITINAVANDTDPDTSDDLLIIGFDQPDKGSVTLNSQNQLVFDPGSDFQDLDSGQAETVTFDYTISDGNGGSDTATVTILINGSEDATVTNPDFEVTDENTPVVVDVLANDSDPDANDNPLTVTAVGATNSGKGSVAITNGGVDVTFDPGSDFDDLAVGETEIVTFEYETNTGATETATITIEGQNDDPIAVNDTGSVDEDATLTVTAANGVILGLGTDTDVDGTDVLEVSAIRTGPESGTGTGALVGNPLVGTYGTLTLAEDGSYTYVADQDAADPLAVGVTATDTFTYEISDGNGGTDTAELVITVTGTNDGPLPNPPGGTPGVDPGVYDDEDTIDEDAVVPATGNVLANDVDLDIGDTLEVSEVDGVAGDVGNPVVGTYGTVTIDQDGDYSYALDNTNPVVQALAVGESTTDTFTYTADDGNGGSATATLTITINGVNDVPPSNPPGGTPGVDFGVYDDSNSIAEDEFPNTVIGNVLSNDLDPDGDTLTVSEVDGAAANTGSQVDGMFGTVTIDEDGSYSYTLDNSNPTVQALGVGESTTDTFTYTADDGNGGTATADLTITITGTNDGPEAIDDSGSGDEDNDITGNVITNDTDIDGDSPLIVVANTDPANGSVVIAPNGAYTYTPDPDFNGTDSFTYTIQDPSGATDTATVTLTVNPVNDPPVAGDDNGEVEENDTVTIDVLDNDSDVDGDTLTVTSIDDSGLTGGSATLNGDNTITFDPGTDFENLAVGATATETLSYVVDDGNGGSDTATITITIEGQNDAPVAVDDSGSGDEDTSITGNVVTNDTDVDGDTPLTVVSNTTPAHGTLVIAANGAYTYTPDPDYNGLDSFTYTIEDPSGASDTATVTLTINPANDPPIAVDDSGVAEENTAVTIDVLDNDSDIEGDTLTVTSIDDSGLTGGSATLNGDNTVTFNPGTDFDDLAVGESTTETLTYVVEDGNGGSDTATITVTIEGTNDGPVAVNDTDAVDEDATLVVSAANGVIQGPGTDTDADTSDVLEVSAIRTGPESGTGTGALVGNPLVGTYGTLTLNEDGSYTYVADQDAADPLAVGVTATDTFTYEISDGNGGTDTAELVITVTGTNDGPLPNPPGGTPGVDPGVYDDEDTIDEDAVVPATGNVLANDVDLDIGDTFEVSEVNGASGSVGNPVVGTYGTVTIDQDGDYSYALDNTNPVVQALAVGESTTDTFTYTADDGNGGSATATLTITINGVNDVPPSNPPGGTPGVDFGVYDDDNSIAEDEFPNSVIGNVLSNDLDPDGDTLTVSEVDGAAANTGSQVDGMFGTVTIDEDGSYSYVLDNSNPTVQALGVGQSTIDTFTYTANDGNGGTATADLTITITGTNDGPEAIDDSGSGDEDNDITGNVITNDIDIDGDSPLIVVANTDPGNGSVVIAPNGAYTYTPDPDFNGTDSFTYTIQDPSGATDTATVTLTVNPVNDPPVAGDDDGVVEENDTVTIEVLDNDSDVDGDTLTVTSIDDSGLTGGTATLNGDNTITFDPGTDFENLAVGASATETLTYVVDDGNGGSDTATVTITIEGQNDDPLAVDDNGVGDEDTSITGNVVANDSDVDGDTPLTVVSNTTPAHGTLVIAANGAYTYTPDPDYNGLDSFTYTIEDGNGGSDTATVTLTINPANDPPIALDDSGVAEENAPVTIDVLDNDSDIEGDTLTVTSIDDSGLTGGSATLNVDNTVTFDPGTDFDDLAVGETATETLTYVVEDGNGGSDTATITVTIEGQNDDPIAVNDTGSVDEDATLTVTAANGVIQGLGTDTDADGTDVLEVSAIRTGPESGTGTGALVGNPLVGTYGTLTLAEDGSYTYVADQDAADPLAVGVTATDTFTYEISDGNGGTDTAELVITVTGTNDGPLPNPPGGTPGVDPGVYDDEDTIDEDAVVPATGNVLTNDVDLDIGDTFEVSEVNGVAGNVDNPVVGTYGSVTIDQDGDYSYALDNTNPVVQALAVGESTTDTFTYTADDGNGGSATATLTITINGVNDVPPSNPPGGTPGVDFGVYDDSNSIAEDEFPNSVIGNVLSNDLDPDGDTLTVSEVGGSAANTGSQVDGAFGTVVIDEDGSYSYTLDNGNATIQALGVGQSTTDTFTYTADDGNGGTATATLTITISGTNDAPLAADDSGSGDEDMSITGNVITNDSDIDGDTPLTVVSNTTPAHGMLVIAGNGAYTYTPDPDYNGLDSFTYTIEDPSGASDTATVMLTINPVNDPPVAVDDTAELDENTPVTIDVLDNDTDTEGDDLTVTSINDSALSGGSATLNGDSTVTFDPGTDFDYLAVGETSIETLTYVVDDGNGGTDTATVTITVEGRNDTPIAVNDTGSVNEDATLVVNAANGVIQTNDTDADGTDVLEVSMIRTGLESGAGTGALVGNPLVGTYGTLTLNADGSYSYVADQDAADPLAVGVTATDTFTYEISDGNGGSDTAELVITITGTNDAPQPNPPGGTPGIDPGVYDDSNTIAEDAAVPATGNVLANDVDLDIGDTLEVSEVNGVAGNVTNPVVGIYGAVTINQDGSYSYVLDNTNPVVQALAVGESTTDIFTYTADDGNGGSATATLTITINGTNDVPPSNPPGGTPGVDFGVYDDGNSITEDAVVPVTGDVLANDLDPDGDTLRVSAVEGVAANVDNPVAGSFGTVIIDEDGSYSYVLDNSNATVQALGVGQSTVDTFTYTADDGNGGAANATLTITINGTNDAPVALDDNGVGDEDMSIMGNVITNDSDVDGDTPLTVVSNTTPANGTLVIAANGAYTYTPNADFNGLDSFSYTIQDPSGASATATATVTLTVNPVNDPPIAVDDAVVPDENTPVTIDVLNNDTDTEGDTLTVTSINDSGLSGGSATLNGDSTITFDPGTDFDGLALGETSIETLTYVVDDGNGGTDTATVSITVEGVNDAPTAVDDVGAVDEDATLVVNAVNGVIQTNDTDPDGTDVLEVESIRTGPESGSGTGALVGNPLVGTYGTLTLNVDGSYNYVADQDAADPLAVGVTATETFTYEISDGNGGSDTAELVITITGTNDAPPPNPPGGTPGVDPGVYDDSNTTAEDAPAPATGNVLANDVDLDIGDVLMVSEVNGVAGNVANPVVGTYGTVTIGTNGVYSYALDNSNPTIQALAVGETTTDTFTYTADDGNGGSATATLTITINGTNEAPDAVDDVYRINENEVFSATLSNDILENDSDSNGDPLQVNTTPVVNVTNGNLVLNGDGTFTYTPDPDFQGTDSFTYEISDGNGGTDTATVTLHIDNDRDGYTNDVDLDDDNDGILDTDECVDTTIGFSVIVVPDHLDAGNVGELTDGNKTYTGDQDLRLHHPNTLYAGDHAGVIQLDQEAPSGTQFTIFWENDDADGGDAQDFADALNASGLDHTYFDRNGDNILDGSDFDVDGNGDVDSGTGDYSPLGIVISFYSGDPGFPAGTGPGTLVHREITPVELMDSVVHSFTVTAPVEFDYIAIESIADDDGGDPRLIEFEFNSTTNDGSNTFVDSECDTDGDGTPNRLELDSDNGGIFDVDETGNGGLDANNDGQVDGAVDANGVPIAAAGGFDPTSFPYDPYEQFDDLPIANDDFVASPTAIQPVTIDVVANDTDQNGTIDPTTVDLSPGTPGIQNTRVVAGEGTWSTDGSGNVTFTPDPALDSQPTPISYAVSDDDGNVASADALLTLKYSAADIWFGNDESGSVNGPDFDQSRVLISGTADQMEFSSGDIVFNAALFSWAGTGSQQVELAIQDDKTQFVNDSSSYSRNFSGLTDIGDGIVFGTQQILNHVQNMQNNGDPRAGVPQVMVILTDASASQIFNDSSLLADSQAAKDAGIIMVFVAIQEAQQDPAAVAILEQASSLDTNGGPLVVTATNYADIDAGEIADLLNAVREAAALGLLPPVVIDMDGDGVEFDDIENGILFDADGDGVQEKVAWADEDDAVLVYDENGNNNIDGLNEIAFARYADEIGATDLDGLRHFDSNDDLILDANDAEFESFKLWQDKNGDGIVDEGEMLTLTEAGIESLELVSDGNGYYTAGGDVQVHGEAAVNYADGSQGTLADSTFAYEELDSGADELEILTDQGETLDVNGSGLEPGSADPDLLEPAPPVAGEASGEPIAEGGAVSGTSIEDDMAASDAAMS